MKFILGIPYVNRPDLLEVALRCVRDFWAETVVVDNSGALAMGGYWGIYRPGVVLSTAQSFNWVAAKAIKQGCEFFLLMHSDVECDPGTIEKLVEAVRLREGEKWAFRGTNTDQLAAYSCSAFADIGPFDANLPTYYTDNDWQYRARLKGYTYQTCGGDELEKMVRHQCWTEGKWASATVNSDPKRRFLQDATGHLRGEYYRLKWGGGPGLETFKRPFDSDLFSEGPGFDGQI